MAGKGSVFVGKAALRTATPKLLFFCLVYALGSVFFGYDSGSFGGVQAFAPFQKRFGHYDADADKHALDRTTKSLMNSLPLLGKLLGALTAGPLIERLGHKKAMVITCGFQIGGAIIEVTSHAAAQFIVGRFLVYLAVGLVENITPTYQCEIAPAALRGFFIGSIQLCLTFGSLLAGIVNKSMSKKTDSSGWQIATSIQAVPPVIILMLVWWTPDSPRWLLFQDRSEDALKTLRTVRRRADVDAGVCEMEIAAMRDDGQAATRKGPWKDLVRGTNLRRTGIALTIMILQQLTGVTFSSSYGPTFYKSEGLGQKAFTYSVISNGVSVVTALIAMVVLDVFGRRSVVFHGCWGQALFLGLIGGLGSKSHRSESETHGMVAAFIIYFAILHMSLGPAAYITAAEVGTGALREKTMAVATGVNVIASFIVVEITPYLLDDLGPKLGYVWMAFALLGSVWAFFFLPELKGRNLEEVDELFEARVAAWRFQEFETTGLGHDIAAIGQGNLNPKVADNVELRELGASQ